MLNLKEGMIYNHSLLYKIYIHFKSKHYFASVDGQTNAVVGIFDKKGLILFHKIIPTIKRMDENHHKEVIKFISKKLKLA